MDLTVQATAFGLLMLTGALLGFIFDLYRVLQGIRRPSNVMTMAADVVYWIAATVIVGGALLYTNGGEMRLYVIIALLSGAGVYFRLLSRLAVRLTILLLRWVSLIMRWVKAVFYCLFIKPFTYPIRGLSWIFAAVFGFMRQWCKKFCANKQDPPVK
ncbi:MAG: spore cortex biosynthesis protein YabQ [Negativicutes bacterium]|nr:spore cortex biosynthesis protein YabQ [Negativicutes bacterium]